MKIPKRQLIIDDFFIKDTNKIKFAAQKYTKSKNIRYIIGES